MKAYGFVNLVVSGDALRKATQSLAEEIAAKSPIALRRMKEVANTAGDKSRDAALQHESVMFRKHMRSYDATEGLQAFSEKRAPASRATDPSQNIFEHGPAFRMP